MEINKMRIVLKKRERESAQSWLSRWVMSSCLVVTGSLCDEGVEEVHGHVGRFVISC